VIAHGEIAPQDPPVEHEDLVCPCCDNYADALDADGLCEHCVAPCGCGCGVSYAECTSAVEPEDDADPGSYDGDHETALASVYGADDSYLDDAEAF